VATTRKEKEKVTQAELRARKQVLLLWAILGEGGGKDVSRYALEKKGMLPGDDKAARDALLAQGLIKVEPRSYRNDNDQLVRGVWMSVTDEGRTWAEENLAAVPAKAFAATPILQAWLTRLSAYMSANRLSLIDVLGPQYSGSDEALMPAPQPATTPPRDYEALRGRIRHAYLAVTGGQLNKGVPLRDLREKLADIDRAELDEALGRMHLEEGTTLSGLNNPLEITPAIREAAFSFKGEPMYVLWITK
jgi:hypothetical protein